MNHHRQHDITGSTPDAVVIQRREAERFGKHLRGTVFEHIGKPIPVGILHYRRAKLIAAWRDKGADGKWGDYRLYGLQADGTITSCWFLVEDETAVEVDALPAIIKAMFESRMEVTL